MRSTASRIVASLALMASNAPDSMIRLTNRVQWSARLDIIPDQVFDCLRMAPAYFSFQIDSSVA